LPNATLFKPQQPYKRCIVETFKDFPTSALPLIETLLSVDPDDRVTATAALNSEVSDFNSIICQSSLYILKDGFMFCKLQTDIYCLTQGLG
jgi:cyclin-dependent kinase 12/13/sacsin